MSTRLAKDDDLLVGLPAIAAYRGRSLRVMRDIVDAGELPIWFESNVPVTRKSILIEHDTKRALEYLEVAQRNAAAGVKRPGRPKNVKKAQRQSAAAVAADQHAQAAE